MQCISRREEEVKHIPQTIHFAPSPTKTACSGLLILIPSKTHFDFNHTDSSLSLYLVSPLSCSIIISIAVVGLASIVAPLSGHVLLDSFLGIYKHHCSLSYSNSILAVVHL